MPSSSNKRNSNSRKSTYRKKTVKKNSSEAVSMTKDIILLALLVFSLLIFISNFGFGGKFTEGLSGVFFGLFGIVSYIFPVFMIFIIFHIIAGRRIETWKSRIVSVSMIFISLCAFFQLLDKKNSSNYSLPELFLYAKRTNKGGGFLGACIYKILYPAIGTVGLVIVIVFVITIAIMLLTGKSIINYIADIINNRSEERKREATNTRINRANITSNKQDREYKTKEIVENKNDKFVIPVLNGYSSDEVNALEMTNANAQDIGDDFKTDKKLANKKIRKAKSVKEANDNLEFNSDATDFKQDLSVNEIYEEQNDNNQEEMPVSEKKKKERAGVEALKESDFNKLGDVDTFKLPPIDLLNKNPDNKIVRNEAQLRETALTLQNTFKSFGVNIKITDVSCGPAVTRYEFRPEAGIKVSKILSLADDIKLNLAASDLRIEAPVPGKAAVGIEVPNSKKSMVLLRDLLESEELKENKSPLAFPAGKDVSGKVIVADLAKMPHMLISGTTGSGKSVLTNSILLTYLFRCKPDDVRFIIIDPKVVEFGVYNGIPNLIIPVVTDPKKAAGALNWAVSEMTERYKKFQKLGVRDLGSYNKCVEEKQYDFSLEEGEEEPTKLPNIVIIIDELADLMMVAAKEVEEAICRLAQLARAAGIHMIIATQRPSVDVITGLIKANVPSRVALTVASGTDSRTIIDMNGAEKLLGKGDMLFYPSDYPKPLRVQGSFVSDKEISKVVSFLKGQAENNEYDENVIKLIDSHTLSSGTQNTLEQSDDDGRDELFWDAARLICDKQKASIGSLQRYFRIGFNRAARIMDQLCESNIVGPEQGTKPREILMSLEELDNLQLGVSDDEE